MSAADGWGKAQASGERQICSGGGGGWAERAVLKFPSRQLLLPDRVNAKISLPSRLYPGNGARFPAPPNFFCGSGTFPGSGPAPFSAGTGYW